MILLPFCPLIEMLLQKIKSNNSFGSLPGQCNYWKSKACFQYKILYNSFISMGSCMFHILAAFVKMCEFNLMRWGYENLNFIILSFKKQIPRNSRDKVLTSIGSKACHNFFDFCLAYLAHIFIPIYVSFY